MGIPLGFVRKCRSIPLGFVKNRPIIRLGFVKKGPIIPLGFVKKSYMTEFIIAGTAEDMVNKGGLTEMVLGWELIRISIERPNT